MNREGRYVLYWMIASRRARWNAALDHALQLCAEWERPLLVLEPLRVGYRYASDRFHRFVLDGMADNQKAFDAAGIRYFPYVEPEAGAGQGLLGALAEDACAVVTDDYPCFFLPRMVEAAGGQLQVRLEAVDSNGIYPIRRASKEFTRAYDFRRHLQAELRPHLEYCPATSPDWYEGPTSLRLPNGIHDRWPAAADGLLSGSDQEALAALPIDHDVPPVDYRGGMDAAAQALTRFLDERLPHYGDRDHPERERTSGLSPYLHFGHVSAHQILQGLADREGWEPSLVASSSDGKRSGWWNMSAVAEGFMDQLVTWRELGFNVCVHRDDYDAYSSVPEWARKTLAEHEEDDREWTYSLEEFESAQTHDELWNAAQTQLRVEGRIHNYLRMLWGKKILHWSSGPSEAARIMVHLNDKYAVDGRDPNSYSGIYWILGRHDRAWGPERDVFGKVRYMTSDSTRRKLAVKGYLDRWGGCQSSLAL